MAKGLFHHNAALSRSNLVSVQTLRNHPEQRRRHGEVKRAHNTVTQLCTKLGPAAIARGIDSDIANLFKKRRHQRSISRRTGRKCGEAFRHLSTKARLVHLAACHADDAGLFRHLPHSKAVEQPRQNLALRQVATGPEYNEVKRLNRNNSGDHRSARHLHSSVVHQTTHPHTGVEHAVGEAPFVVIPAHHTNHATICHRSLRRRKARRMRIVVEIN